MRDGRIYNRFGALVVALLVATSAAAATVETIEAGDVRFEVHTASRTAILFHVVDQMSGWSQYCHEQYVRWWTKTYGPLTEEDRGLLAEHAAARRKRGWGGGFEQSLYVAANLDRALADAVSAGYLTQGEADTEKKVLLHFAPGIDKLTADLVGADEAFLARLRAKKADLLSFAAKAARLFGTKNVDVPVYLIPNPDDDFRGGGFNGGIISLEVPPTTNVFPTLLHECFHAFVNPQKPRLEAAIAGVDGLDEQTLNEAIAYAIAPGLLHDSSRGDPLRDEALEDLKDGKQIGTDAFMRFHWYALALRPLVKESLDDPNATLDTFLPRAIDAWRTLHDLPIGPPAIGGR